MKETGAWIPWSFCLPRRLSVKLILRFAIFFGTIAICYSQSATLTGVVTDSSEALVAAARVSVVNLETGLLGIWMALLPIHD